MDRYTAAATLRGVESFVLDGENTFAICVGDNHADNAELIARLLNEDAHAEQLLLQEVGGEA